MRYTAKFHLDHYSDLTKSFDGKEEAIAYWLANNGGKHHNGGVWDNEATGKYKWVS